MRITQAGFYYPHTLLSHKAIMRVVCVRDSWKEGGGGNGRSFIIIQSPQQAEL